MSATLYCARCQHVLVHLLKNLLLPVAMTFISRATCLLQTVFSPADQTMPLFLRCKLPLSCRITAVCIDTFFLFM